MKLYNLCDGDVKNITESKDSVFSQKMPENRICAEQTSNQILSSMDGEVILETA